jgi:thiamine biosynthesis lipoprotein
MGTRCELVVLEGRGDLLAAGEAALEEIEHWHARLSRFADDSLLSHIHRTAARAPVRLDRETYALFEEALAVWRASDGAFDVTVAPLMARHGFQDSAVPASSGRVGTSGIAPVPDPATLDPGRRERGAPRARPAGRLGAGGASASLAEALAEAGGAKPPGFSLDPDRWTISLLPGTAIDLGAIAKGHALACAAGVLRAAGVTSALLHGGTSSVVAIGAPPGSPGWQVAVGLETGTPVVRLRDSALSVSDASSQRGGSSGGGHILDPRTGRAAACGGRVVVVGPSARLADAWSTALAVLRRVPRGFPAGFTADLHPVCTMA